MTRYFKDSEFFCSCGNCDKNHNDVNKFSLARLDEARHLAGIPFHINSSIRCNLNNELMGGRPKSAHLSGQAFDVRVTNSSDRFTIIDAAIRAGFKRIGIAKGFIHLDDDSRKSPRVAWLY